jgi:hypothetical protein
VIGWCYQLIDQLFLSVLAQFVINGRVAEGKKPFDGERPRVSLRLKGFWFFEF